MGTWTGVGETVIFGSNRYHPHAPRLGVIEGFLKITGQDGRRVWGVVGAGDHSENVALIATSDGVLIGADHGGLFRVTTLPDGRLDHCYTHAAISPFRIDRGGLRHDRKVGIACRRQAGPIAWRSAI